MPNDFDRSSLATLIDGRPLFVFTFDLNLPFFGFFPPKTLFELYHFFALFIRPICPNKLLTD
jgi:hypothetical protein